MHEPEKLIDEPRRLIDKPKNKEFCIKKALLIAGLAFLQILKLLILFLIKNAIISKRDIINASDSRTSIHFCMSIV
jgi:hypothetical protein